MVLQQTMDKDAFVFNAHPTLYNAWRITTYNCASVTQIPPTATLQVIFIKD